MLCYFGKRVSLSFSSCLSFHISVQWSIHYPSEHVWLNPVLFFTIYFSLWPSTSSWHVSRTSFGIDQLEMFLLLCRSIDSISSDIMFSKFYFTLSSDPHRSSSTTIFRQSWCKYILFQRHSSTIISSRIIDPLFVAYWCLFSSFWLT